MKLVISHSEVLNLEVIEFGIKSCDDLEIRPGQTIGEAACLSPCRCPFCDMIRKQVAEEPVERAAGLQMDQRYQSVSL